MSFFNKLGKTITDTTHSVVEKTKSSTDTIRLNGLISDEERSINAAYLSIGKKYEELHGENFEPEFAEFFGQMAESRRKIEEYRDQIRKNKHLMLCQTCGNEIAETALFCTKCGAENPVGKRLAEEQAAAQKAAAQAAAAQPQPVYGAELCPNCGRPKTPGALFCTGCGARFAPAAAPTPAPAPVPVQPAVSEPVPTPVPVPEEAAPAPVSTPAETVSSPEPAPVMEETAPSVETETVSEAAPVLEESIPAPVSATAEKVCPNCGRVVPEGNRFCTGCGTKMEGEAAEKQEKTCPVCGKLVPSENRFCTSCGAKVDA